MLKRFLCICLILLPSVAKAQPADSLVRILDRFNNGAAIQINQARGHFFGVRNGSVVFEGLKNVQNIPLTDVNEVWKQKSHAKTGAITGAVITGVSFALIGSFLVSVTCENSDTHCRGDYPIVAAYGLTLGGVSGGLVGGLIGYAFKKWQRVY
jgi:hypothetical protein